MAEFKCEVVKIRIEDHPNADAIEIAKVGDYQSIVRKGQFKDGELAIYIPEQAVVPEAMLKEMGLWDEAKNKGGLAGSLGNRVKAIKLRGVLSQGLIVANSSLLAEGDDAAEFLGITKYEPPLPSHMQGKALGADLDATTKYDFDNLKKTPNLFEDGEDVVITEKIHGTLIQIGVVPTRMANEKFFGGRVVISSKGLGARGVILDHNDETNIYAQTAKKHDLLQGMLELFGDGADRQDKPVFLLGEVFGKTLSGAGVQDLTYTGEALDFRAFDISVGNRGTERFLEWDHFTMACEKLNVKTVPALYVGPYSKEVVLEHTDGATTLVSVEPRGKEKAAHIREGVVVKSATEKHHAKYGRKIAKSVSEAYLLRKGNATEFN